MAYTKQQIRQLRRDNAKWPEYLSPVPFHDWPADTKILESPSCHRRMAVLRSREFLVQVFDEGNLFRLSVCRTDYDLDKQRFRDDISWDDLQRLKAQAGYADKMAVEIYPPDDKIVNVANMRHIWVLPEPMPFMWGVK